MHRLQQPNTVVRHMRLVQAIPETHSSRAKIQCAASYRGVFTLQEQGQYFVSKNVPGVRGWHRTWNQAGMYHGSAWQRAWPWETLRFSRTRGGNALSTPRIVSTGRGIDCTVELRKWGKKKKRSVFRTRESQQVPIFSSLQACNINISSFSVKCLIIISLGSLGIVCTAYSRVQRQETVGRFGALLKGEAETCQVFCGKKKKMIARWVTLQRTRRWSWWWFGYHSFSKCQGATTKTTGYPQRAYGSKPTTITQKSVATWFCRALSYQYTEEGASC